MTPVLCVSTGCSLCLFFFLSGAWGRTPVRRPPLYLGLLGELRKVPVCSQWFAAPAPPMPIAPQLSMSLPLALSPARLAPREGKAAPRGARVPKVSLMSLSLSLSLSLHAWHPPKEAAPRRARSPMSRLLRLPRVSRSALR